MKRGTWTILALPLLTIPAHAAEKPVYHDCRPSEDIVEIKKWYSGPVTVGEDLQVFN